MNCNMRTETNHWKRKRSDCEQKHSLLSRSHPRRQGIEPNFDFVLSKQTGCYATDEDDIFSILGLTDSCKTVVPNMDKTDSLTSNDSMDYNPHLDMVNEEKLLDDIRWDFIKEDVFLNNLLEYQHTNTFYTKQQLHTCSTLFNVSAVKNNDVKNNGDDDVFIMRSPIFQYEDSMKPVTKHDTSEENDIKKESTTNRRKKPNNCYHLWDFLNDILDGKIQTKHSCIELVDNKQKEFKITNTSILARMWGEKKQTKNPMTYDKLSRTLRYYCSLDILKRIPGKRLQFRFGNGRMWNKSFKKHPRIKN